MSSFNLSKRLEAELFDVMEQKLETDSNNKLFVRRDFNNLSKVDKQKIGFALSIMESEGVIDPVNPESDRNSYSLDNTELDDVLLFLVNNDGTSRRVDPYA